MGRAAGPARGLALLLALFVQAPAVPAMRLLLGYAPPFTCSQPVRAAPGRAAPRVLSAPAKQTLVPGSAVCPSRPGRPEVRPPTPAQKKAKAWLTC